MNVQLYWKYLVGLLIYAILLNIPFCIYLDSISNAITNFFSIHDKNNRIGYLIYGIMILIQLPLVMQLLKDMSYKILYGLVGILMAIFNPYSFLTTPYKPWYLVVLIVLLFISLKFAFSIIKVFLLVLISVISTNEILAFYYKPTFAFLTYLIFYIVGYGIFFITLNPDRFRPVFHVVDWLKKNIL